MKIARPHPSWLAPQLEMFQLPQLMRIPFRKASIIRDCEQSEEKEEGQLNNSLATRRGWVGGHATNAKQNITGHYYDEA